MFLLIPPPAALMDGCLLFSVIAAGAGLAALFAQRRAANRITLAHPDLVAALERVEGGLTPLDAALADLRQAQAGLLQRERRRLNAPGLVQFQAFGPSGPALSFSLALLDDAHNGLVLTALHGRDQTRLYAKPVLAGVPAQELGEEEAAALRLALGGGGREVLAAEPEPAPPRAVAKAVSLRRGGR